MLTRLYSTAATIGFTLAVVALACSHNHANAPWVALALAVVSGAALWRQRHHRRQTAA